MLELLILFVLLVLSGFFSGSETALTSLSRARADSLAKEQRSGSRALWTLKKNTTRMLVIILIGNNLVNIAASAMATVIATEKFGHLGPGIAVGLLTLFILVFGEVTPKSWAAHHAERVSLIAAPLILAFGRLVFPVVWALERFTEWLHRVAAFDQDPMVTESEVISLVEHGALEGTIESGEVELIERVFAFNDLTVRDVMTPRSEIFSLPGELPVRDALPEILRGSATRIPVFRNGPDDISGIIYLRDLLESVVKGEGEASLQSIAHEPTFVPQTQPIDELFAGLRQAKRHMALVVNEYGLLQGVVTLEDLLEELVGEIYDESDRAPEMVREAGPGEILVRGNTEVREVGDYFRKHLTTQKPTDTVSLWILSYLGRIPRTEEKFSLDGLEVYVERASNRFIQQVRIKQATEHKGEEAGTAE